MLGTSLQFRRGHGHGEDRFYDAAKARRSHHQNPQRSRSSAAASVSPSPAPISRGKAAPSADSREPENRAGSEEPSKPAAVPSSSSAPAALAPSSNLDRFLESTTPSVPAQYLSKTRMRGWRTCDVEYRPYFNLGDLWESFKEWSAYGAGVPLVLNDSDCVVQYYVPYMSAIQLYGEQSRQPDSFRRPGEESDVDSYRDSSSDGNSDCELERGPKYSRDWSRNHLESTSMLRVDRLSLRGTHIATQDGFSRENGETGNSQGCLLFEYLEQDPPYSREPLADKVLDLARYFPDLKTFRSCDLSPASWISVAWYPIYRIPTGPTLKDLDACFLTFHSLSTPMTGAGAASGPTVTYPQGADGIPMVSLPMFGLASYKFKGSIWTPSGGCERLAGSLLQDADNWLRRRNVAHPDYQFFTSHGAYTR